MQLRLVSAVLLAAAVGGAPALACKGRQEMFSDDFTVADSSWHSDDDFSILSGRIRLRPQAGQSAVVVYQGGKFGDADICVDVTVPQARDPAALRGGLVFWFGDGSFHLFEVTPDGKAAITLYQRGRASPAVPLRNADGFRTEAGAPNMLRLTLKGSDGTAYVNDQPFGTFKGEPPRGGGQIGFYGRSEPYAANIWTFGKIRITD